MGRRTIKRRGRAQIGRPSAFFIIALAIGVAVLIFVFVQILRHPQKEPVPRRQGQLNALVSKFG